MNEPDPIGRAVEGWMKSPGHRRNILDGEYTRSGIGIWREGASVYITEEFLRPRETAR